MPTGVWVTPWPGRELSTRRTTTCARLFDLFAELGDATGQSDVYNGICAVYEQQGNVTDGFAHARRGLDLARISGSPQALARNLNGVGWYHVLLGEPERALTHCRQALAISREIGDRRTQAVTLDSLGYAHYLLGQYQQAIEHFQRSSAIQRELNNQHSHANHLDLLGDVHYAAGDHNAARDAWQQALNILDRLGLVRAGIGPGFPDADEIN